VAEQHYHWLKLWTRGWLEGSIRFDLTAAQRSVFVDLCALARESRNPPMVQANETTAYPHSWLASKLNIPLDLLEETLEICKKGPDPRISENNTGIKVLKFQYYQEKHTEKKKPEEGNPILAALSQNYEKEIGVISPTIASELADFAQYYQERGAPIEWIEEAFAEAARNNKRNWVYVKAILKNWIEQGKGMKKSRGRRLPTEEEIRKSVEEAQK